MIHCCAAAHCRTAAQTLEALRRAFIKEWYDFVDSGADSDITQDDMDNLKSVTASTISAEVTRFLNEEKLDDGPCEGLTFTV